MRGVAGLAFSAPQPPGSTFKIITATAALDAGVVELDDEFPVEVSNSDIGREITNAGDAPCGGTFVESFANSCNTVFAPLGVETGQEQMVETAEAFGFNTPPALAAPDELEALAPPTPSLGEIESDVALGESSIGQGQVLATPLLMASVAQTIANEGVRLPTSIVKTQELRPDAEPVEVTSPGDGPEGRGDDARGRALGNQHGRADSRGRGRRQVGHGRARAPGARAGPGPRARRGPSAGRGRVVCDLRPRRQAPVRDRGASGQHARAAAAQSRRRSRATSTPRYSRTSAPARPGTPAHRPGSRRPRRRRPGPHRRRRPTPRPSR